MRAIIQRVMKASVTVEDEIVSSIGKGLCVLIGISRDDNVKDVEYIVRKILNTRVFEDEGDKRWSKNVMDKQYEVLCVSQFTLYHVLKGNKPDFHQAIGGDESKAFYEEFLKQIRASYKPDMIKVFSDGAFGAHMQVNIQNDGPVTLTLESPHQELKKDPRQQKAQKAQQNKLKDKKSGEQEEPSAENSSLSSVKDNNSINQKSPEELETELSKQTNSALTLES